MLEESAESCAVERKHRVGAAARCGDGEGRASGLEGLQELGASSLGMKLASFDEPGPELLPAGAELAHREAGPERADDRRLAVRFW